MNQKILYPDLKEIRTNSSDGAERHRVSSIKYGNMRPQKRGEIRFMKNFLEKDTLADE